MENINIIDSREYENVVTILFHNTPQPEISRETIEEILEEANISLDFEGHETDPSLAARYAAEEAVICYY
jgi:hypothetical protein